MEIERTKVPLIRFGEDLMMRAVEEGLRRSYDGTGSARKSGHPPTHAHHIIGAMAELAFGTWFGLDPPLRADLERQAYDHVLWNGDTVQVKGTTSYPPRLVVWITEHRIARHWVLVHVFANDPGPERPVPFDPRKDWRGRLVGFISTDTLERTLPALDVDPDGISWRLHRNHLSPVEQLREIASRQVRLL